MAAVRAAHSSVPSAFCTACGLGITAPVHCINYLGQERLCKRKACQHAFNAHSARNCPRPVWPELLKGVDFAHEPLAAGVDVDLGHLTEATDIDFKLLMQAVGFDVELHLRARGGRRLRFRATHAGRRF